MNTNFARVVVGPLFVIGSIAAVYVFQRSEMAELRTQITRLEAARSEMRHLSGRQPDPSTTGEQVIRTPPQTSIDPPVVQGTSPAPVTLNKEPAAETRSASEVRDLLSARFQVDHPDRSRAAMDAFHTISNAVSDLEPTGVRLQSLECREQMCMMKLDFRDGDVDRTAMRALFRGERQLRMGGVMVPERNTEPNGHVVATVYIARQGDIPLD